MASSPFVFFAHERLSPAELSSARLDGHLIELGEGYVPADAVEDTWLRAASLRPILGTALAASHVTASWVHGALAEPPVRHTVLRAVARRLHAVPDRRLVCRDTKLAERDVDTIAGVRVTTRCRTLADLARQIARGDASPQVARAARSLAGVTGAPRAAIVCLATQGSVAGKPAAIRLLREWEQDPPTMS